MNHTTNITQSEPRRSTYSLLVGSEEKSRGVFEIAIYAAVIISSVVSIWQVAQQRITVPSEIGISSMAAAAKAAPTQNS